MSNMWHDIQQFHENFLLPQNEFPSLMEKEMCEFRMKFMQEELAEFEDAVERKDLVKAFDALIDLAYVVLGTAYICNFPWAEGWSIVHEANMKKTRVKKLSDSLRGSMYDVVKPDGWVPPDDQLKQLLLNYGSYDIK